MIPWDEARCKMLEVVNLSVDDSVGQLWFCNKCKKSLQWKKIPAGSQFNDMKVAKVPSALWEIEHFGRMPHIKGHCFHEDGQSAKRWAESGKRSSNKLSIRCGWNCFTTPSPFKW